MPINLEVKYLIQVTKSVIFKNLEINRFCPRIFSYLVQIIAMWCFFYCNVLNNNSSLLLPIFVSMAIGLVVISREHFEHELTWLAFKSTIWGSTLSEKRSTSWYARWIYREWYVPKLSLQDTVFCHMRTMLCFGLQFPQSTHGMLGPWPHFWWQKQFAFSNSGFPMEARVIKNLF